MEQELNHAELQSMYVARSNVGLALLHHWDTQGLAATDFDFGLQILALGCPAGQDVHAYVSFITTYMFEFVRITRCLEDLQRAMQLLYPVYMQPVTSGQIKADNAKALFAAFTPHFKAAVASFSSGASASSFASKQQKAR